MRSISPRWFAIAAVLLAWAACSSVTKAQVELDLEDFPGLPEVMDPGFPRTTFRLLNLVISSDNEFALVQYTQQTDDGPVLTRIGWIFLSNDRRINYKMTMIAMLRDALDEPDRQVSIGIVPGTGNTTRRIVASVALGPASE
jgi:hypothetical protein